MGERKNLKVNTTDPICCACKHGIVVVSDQPDYDTYELQRDRDVPVDVEEFPVERTEEVYCSNVLIAGENEPPVVLSGVVSCQAYEQGGTL